MPMFPLRQYKFTVCFLKLVMDRLGGRRPPRRHARQKTCLTWVDMVATELLMMNFLHVSVVLSPLDPDTMGDSSGGKAFIQLQSHTMKAMRPLNTLL